MAIKKGTRTWWSTVVEDYRFNEVIAAAINETPEYSLLSNDQYEDAHIQAEMNAGKIAVYRFAANLKSIHKREEEETGEKSFEDSLMNDTYE